MLTRRDALKLAAVLGGTVACHRVGTPVLAHDSVAYDVYLRAIAQAAALAKAPYAGRADEQPPALAQMDYLQHRAIQYRPDKSLWLNDRLALQFFHRGYYHKRGVEIFLQPRQGEARPITYDSANFSGLSTAFPASIGYAGFRVHAPVRDSGHWLDEEDEFLVFLDASYFRLRGQGQSYGLSARGIAVNTGGRDGKLEEFPDFTTFWIIEPETDALEIVALLDGPSLAGAYRFSVVPGHEAEMAVEATLFARTADASFGFAPISTMFAHGENGPPGHLDDFRPQVHDSDGLFWQTTEGAPSWRPLINGRDTPLTTAYPTKAPRTFGFLQRERAYPQYLDVTARYEDRPGLLIDTQRGFGAGAVKLYEIPTGDEYMDNIVGYYSSDTPPVVGAATELAYRMRTVSDESVSAFANVQRTVIGSAERMRPVDPPMPGRRMFFVDWRGRDLPTDKDAPVEADVTASSGTIVQPKVERVAKTGEWRVWFEHRPDGDAIAELRISLTLDGKPLGETWHYTTGDHQIAGSGKSG